MGCRSLSSIADTTTTTPRYKLTIMPRVEVFVVRHGERQDEAARKEFYKREKKIWNANLKADPRAHTLGKKILTFEQALKRGLIPSMDDEEVDTLDPLLTARGHQQAHQSFISLTKTLQDRKVAMFCSPLRRVIGTAMMIGTVALPNHTLSFPQPNEQPDRKDNAAGKSSATIPITVLNGLGDFAASIYHHGGARTLAPMGALRCASTPENNGSPSSPFVQALASMPSHLTLHAKDDASHVAGTVQFWGRHKDNNDAFVPMTPPFSPLDNKLKHNTHIDDESFVYPGGIDKTKKRPAPRNPIYAVDEAVRLTIERGCNVCVIVAHREAIRDLAEQECSYLGERRLPTSYCCIGSFLAEVEEPAGADSMIHYSFHNVWRWEQFGRNAIPQVSIPLRCKDDTPASSLVYIVPGKQIHRICVVQSELSCGWLGSQIWTHSEFRSSSPAKADRTTTTTLDLPIAEGHVSDWIKCIGEVRRKGLKLVGTTMWYLDDGRSSRVLDIEIVGGTRSQVRCLVSVRT